MNTFDLLLLDYLDQPLVLSKSSLNSELTQISKRKEIIFLYFYSLEQ